MNDGELKPELPTEPPPYEPPSIIWRESFEPFVFGISCAKQPGNPPCVTGPVSS